MRQREFILHVDPEPRVPLFRRLARAVVLAIEEGRLKPGDALPGTRQLAEQAGANRKTVVEAIHELEAEGWVVSEPNRGTFVAPTLSSPPRVSLEGAPRAETIGYDLPEHLVPLSAQIPGAIHMADGYPDPRLAPAESLARGYQRALRRHQGNLLGQGEPKGAPLLRETLAQWLAARSGYPVRPEEVLVTRGGMAAMALLGLALLSPGDAVAVEMPGSRQTWEALARRGNIRLVPVRVDAQGLDPDDLSRVLEQQPIRALCLTPRCQFPTTVLLSQERRERILRLSEQHRFAVFEDDHDAEHRWAEHRWDDAPVLPLASQDPGRHVIRVACFSRLLAPGLRLGCINAPAPLVERLARLQRSLEWQGDQVVEWALADLIRDGDLARLMRRTRGVYHLRMEHLARGLEEAFGDGIALERPQGGLSLWIRPRLPIPLETWVDAARLRGLVLYPPRQFCLDGPAEGLRLGFAQHEPEVLDEAVRRLKSAWTDAGTLAG